MKKVSLLILVSMILLLAFTSCDMLPESVVDTLDNVKDKVLGVVGMGHEHVWTDATCESPKTCECGETEGEALGHTWVDANCKSPKTCSVCKATEGEAATDAHVWVDATCEAAKHCEVCGLEDGKKLGHDYADATCTAPKTCNRCGDTTGKAKGHDWADASCAAPKTCNNCGLTEGDVLEHVWVDATCDAPKTCSGCGATEGVALGHVWTDATCTAPKTCSVCEATEGTTLAHQYEITIVEQSCTVDGAVVSTCKVCGDSSTNVIAPAAGHNFGDGEIGCNDSATCYTCGETVEAVGHDWAPANCKSPKTCNNCGLSEGIPADHILTTPTCEDPAICTICELETDIYATHILEQKCEIVEVDGKKTEQITFWCTSCGFDFPLTSVDYLDGADYNGMTPVVNAERGYITSNGDYPVINKDGQYELIVKSTLDYVSPPVDPDPTDEEVPEDTRTKWQKECGQLQLWIPNSSGGNPNFNGANNAVGFLSFKFNHGMDNKDLPLRLQFVDNSLGDTVNGEYIRWSSKWCIEGNFFIVRAADEEGNVKIEGWDGVLLKTVKADENGWTGWIDVKFGIHLDPNSKNANGEYGVITVHYYIDGEYCESISKPLTTLTFGVSSVYLTGSTIAAGKGLMLDDITFGYNNLMAGAWPYDTHTCKYEITDCTKGAICKVCGSTQEAGEHAWVSATCTEAQYCPICNMIGEPALGHELGGASCNDPATCSRPGCGFTSGEEVLGHDWAPATCTEPKTCQRDGCDATEGEALGHDYADATCTAPKTCKRDGCNATEGEPNGHTFGAATCEAPATCTVEGCGATEGKPLGHTGGTAGCATRAKCDVCGKAYGDTAGHTLSYAHDSGAVTYTCTVCSKAFTTDKNYWYDGSASLQGNGGANATNGFSNDGAGNPEIAVEDGNSFYQLLNTTGERKQYQIFVPHGGTTTEFADFSCANNAIGFIAFKINGYTTESNSPIGLQILDARGTSDWDSKTGWNDCAKTILQITTPTEGKVTVNGYNSIVLGTVEVGEDNFTGWLDVVISIQLNSDKTMALNYYLNGKNVGQVSTSMSIITNKIGALYFSGYTTAKDSGIMVDDLAFGFSVGKDWTLGTCDHEWVDATCETPKQCTTCGEVAEPALGHTGGEATCEAKAVCTRCEEEYGELGHVAAPATCASASVCTLCNAELSPKLPHQKLTWAYADGKATYTCGDCNTSYVVDKNYNFDGTGDAPYANMDLNDENDIYATTEEKDGERNGWDTGLPIISDGVYAVINDQGAPGENLQGKATLWIPATNGGVDDFEGFTAASNAIGFYSFSLSLNCDTLFEMQLVDTDMRIEANRPAGKDFWATGAVPCFFKVSAPKDGKVTVTGLSGVALGEVAIGEDGFTKWFDVTVGIELSENTITLHYYLGGKYVATASSVFSLYGGKIDGVYFQIKSHAVGTGVKFDDVNFGYVSTPAAE